MTNKNVMFIGKLNNNNNYSLEMEKWSYYTIYKIENYCKKHNIDLVILKNDDINKIIMPPIFKNRYPWFRSTMISVYAIKLFSTDKKYQKYNNMCYMDIDIDIVKDDENLFDCVNKNAFYSLLVKDNNPIAVFNNILKLYFDLEYNNSMNYINSGVFCMRKEIAHNIGKYLPNNDEWTSFLKRNKDYSKVLADQEVISYAIHLSNTKVIELNEKWNRYYKQKTNNDAFIHYMGKKGKIQLLKLSNNKI